MLEIKHWELVGIILGQVASQGIFQNKYIDYTLLCDQLSDFFLKAAKCDEFGTLLFESEDDLYNKVTAFFDMYSQPIKTVNIPCEVKYNILKIKEVGKLSF